MHHRFQSLKLAELGKRNVTELDGESFIRKAHGHTHWVTVNRITYHEKAKTAVFSTFISLKCGNTCSLVELKQSAGLAAAPQALS